MPAQTGTSNLQAKLSRLGAKAAQGWEKNKNNEVRWGIINLPPDINGGIAQLERAEIGEFKAGSKHGGELFVLLRGIAHMPVEHSWTEKGVLMSQHVQGLGVMITIPLCDTPERSVDGHPKMFEDNMAELVNELQKFEVETSNFQWKDLTNLLSGLQASKPFFKFSTRAWNPPKKNPNDPEPKPMVFTSFDGICSAPVLPSAESYQTDNTGTNGSLSRVEQEYEYGNPDELPDGTVDQGEDDLDALAEAAASDSAAQDRLTELGLAAGMNQQEIDDANSWEDVVKVIRSSEEPGDGGQPEESGLEVGSVVKYCPIDPKTKKPAKKPSQFEITDIDENAGIVSLKSLVNPKVKYSKIPLDKVEAV